MHIFLSFVGLTTCLASYEFEARFVPGHARVPGVRAHSPIAPAKRLWQLAREAGLRLRRVPAVQTHAAQPWHRMPTRGHRADVLVLAPRRGGKQCSRLFVPERGIL